MADSRNRHRRNHHRGQRKTSSRLPFTKMHGLGNDFVVIDLISNPATLSSEQIRELGDRHRGIGFDQLLIIDAPRRPDADFLYRIFNADGSEVEHCGNGARCFAKYVLDRGLIASSPINVETANRLLTLNAHPDGQIQVDMGEPDFTPASLPLNAEQQDSYPVSIQVDGETRNIEFYALSMGNPHAVLVVPDCENAPVKAMGIQIGSLPLFPQGVNVGFMEIQDRQHIRLRVYERGAGETEACGTGACAAVVAGIKAGLLDHTVTADLNGGRLEISWQGEGHPVLMTGPAATVFEGHISLSAASKAGE